MEQRQQSPVMWIWLVVLVIALGGISFGIYSSMQSQKSSDFNARVSYAELMMNNADLYQLKAEVATKHGDVKTAKENLRQVSEIKAALYQMDFDVIKAATERRQVKQSVLN